MKIGLNISGTDPDSSKAAEARLFENLILNVKKGDWQAKDTMVKRFHSLLTSLARKRSDDQATINKLIEAGKKGLFAAADKYKPSVGSDRFHVFALDFIESAMDRTGESGGFLAGLFGKK